MIRRQRGFILIYVVALVAALTVILIQLQLRQATPQRSELELQTFLEKQEAMQLIEFVLSGLSEQKLAIDPRYDKFRRLMNEDPARQNELEDALVQLKAMLDQLGFVIPTRDRGKGGGLGAAAGHDGEGVLFPVREKPYTLKIGAREYTISVQPGNLRPNLNSIAYPALWRYLQYLGLPEEEAKEQAADLIDWIDPDDFRTDARGAEREYYLAAHGYAPRNGPVRSWQELAYVKGVTQTRLQMLRENFMLGEPGSFGVLTERIKPEGIAALAGIKLEAVQTLLKTYAPTAAGKSSFAEEINSLMPEDIAAFDRTVAWKEQAELVRVEISATNFRLHVDYDAKRRRLLATW